tara:strand:+ start:116 stop:496 length:381 start_codon:yes stop_codon:yes gene_type:complete
LSGYNPHFDLDLEFGEKFEGCLSDILNKGKVEVKTERDIWTKTGNLVIEIRYKNKPSGLSLTKADYWAHVMTEDEVIKFILLFPVSVLKRRVKYLLKNKKAKIVMGGDNNQSALILIPLKHIIGKI